MKRWTPLLLVALLVIGTPTASAQTPGADLPATSLDDQIIWLLDLMNGDPAAITAEVLAPRFHDSFLAQVPANVLAPTLAQLATQFAPLTIEDGSREDDQAESPTVAQMVLVAGDGTRLLMAIAIDPASGLIAGLGFQEAPPPVATPAATPVNPNLTDTEVSFVSDGDTLYGSLMVPTSTSTPGPGALIISGSGPTDRNGNSGSLNQMNTNLNLAVTLAESGVTTLRYDKLGSGKTGLATRTDPAEITASLFLQEARDAATFLQAQPSVDPSQLILVGHSEGALFALVLADELSKAGTPPTAVVMVAPLSIRYLDLLEQQVGEQYAAAAASGAVSQAEADNATTELASIVESLRSTGQLSAPIQTPTLAGLFPASSLAFLVEIDQWDPATYAAALPIDLPVLVLHGGKDEQVTSEQVDVLMAGFTSAGNDNVTLVEIPDANHLLKMVDGTPNAAVDYANPALPFSEVAQAAIAEFVAMIGAGS